MPSAERAHARETSEGSEHDRELYPYHGKCPHRCCYNFNYSSKADCTRHERLLHPDDRAQRLADRRRILCAIPKPPLKRTHKCSHQGCTASFSSLNILAKHTFSYGHESIVQLAKRGSKQARHGKVLNREKNEGERGKTERERAREGQRRHRQM